jgi:hypothetical protein
MPFIELRWRPRAMINHRILVHSKWFETEKKKKVNPARYRTLRKLLGKVASRKSGDTLVLLHVISLGYIVVQWIHKVAVYDIMALSWGAQTIGLIVAAGWKRVNLLHIWPVSQANIHGTSCTSSCTYSAFHIAPLLGCYWPCRDRSNPYASHCFDWRQ